MMGVEEVWPALPVPAVLIGPDNLITAINPAAEAFLNAPERQALGKLARVYLRSSVDLNEAMSRVRQGALSLSYRDVSLHLRDGGSLRVDLQLAPLSSGEGTLLILIQPLQIAGQLGRALQAENAAKTAIGLADMLAHEIKNPLAGISGAAQLLSMSLGPEDIELTDLILQETRRIVDLLAQVEQFGDLREPSLRPLNIHDILEKARRSAEIGAASNMRFLDKYDPSLPRISGDADQLLQVFSNLFANAAEAAGKTEGTITIRTYYEYGLRLGPAGRGQAVPLQIEISDDGPGIPDALRDHVFDPFVSSHENGTGLGLALVSKIIASHGGTVVVTSEPGNTTFRISLPIISKPRGDA